MGCNGLGQCCEQGTKMDLLCYHGYYGLDDYGVYHDADFESRIRCRYLRENKRITWRLEIYLSEIINDGVSTYTTHDPPTIIEWSEEQYIQANKWNTNIEGPLGHVEHGNKIPFLRPMDIDIEFHGNATLTSIEIEAKWDAEYGNVIVPGLGFAYGTMTETTEYILCEPHTFNEFVSECDELYNFLTLDDAARIDDRLSIEMGIPPIRAIVCGYEPNGSMFARWPIDPETCFKTIGLSGSILYSNRHQYPASYPPSFYLDRHLSWCGWKQRDLLNDGTYQCTIRRTYYQDFSAVSMSQIVVLGCWLNGAFLQNRGFWPLVEEPMELVGDLSTARTMYDYIWPFGDYGAWWIEQKWKSSTT